MLYPSTDLFASAPDTSVLGVHSAEDCNIKPSLNILSHFPLIKYGNQFLADWGEGMKGGGSNYSAMFQNESNKWWLISKIYEYDI